MKKLIICCLYLYNSMAVATPVTLHFNKINLNQAIYALAHVLHINVILNPKIKGDVTLNLRDAEPTQAFKFLLSTYHLGYLIKNNIWYVAPEEIIQKETITKIWKIKFARAADIFNLIPAAKIKMDDRTNTIYAKDTRANIKSFDELISHLDVPVKQLEIEVRLVSVDCDNAEQLGMGFENTNGNKSAVTDLEQNSTGSFSIAIATLADHSLLDVKLAALESSGRAEILSNPHLFTANLQSASIEAGEEVPYQAISGSGGTAVEFKKAVLGFKVTPQILPNDKVLLSIQINQDRPNNKLILGVPTISTRQLRTNVLANDRQTIVLGGVYEINTEHNEQGLPYLNQIPVLGWLFKQRTKRLAKRELLIFVTPKIL